MIYVPQEIIVFLNLKGRHNIVKIIIFNLKQKNTFNSNSKRIATIFYYSVMLLNSSKENQKNKNETKEDKKEFIGEDVVVIEGVSLQQTPAVCFQTNQFLSKDR